MNDTQHREQLFYVLKQALKSRGYTYAKLAQALEVSELTIKRLFRDKDCKMSRLIEVCSVIGLGFSDLVAMQERMHSPAQYLPIKIEEKIAQNPDLFSVFVLLISHISPQTIASQYQLSESELYQYLRELEKLELLEIEKDNRIRFTVPLPIRLRFDGPLGFPIKRANKEFISHCIENESKTGYSFYTCSRLMRESSFELIQEQFVQLQRDYEYLAAQDQMFYSNDELSLYKMSAAFGLFPVMQLFPLSKKSHI